MTIEGVVEKPAHAAKPSTELESGIEERSIEILRDQHVLPYAEQRRAKVERLRIFGSLPSAKEARERTSRARILRQRRRRHADHRREKD
jgi:hypothetical protein